MKRLSTIELLAIWENYMHHPVIERSLYLLAAVYSMDVNTVAKMSIGERDTRLLKFREWIFGSRLINMASCPQCNEPIEWETDIDDICLQQVPPDTTLKVLKLERDGFEIDFRLPNSYDIMRVMEDPTLAVDEKKFISSCVINVQQQQSAYNNELLPREIIDDISEQMSAADPQADIKMLLNCPGCNNQWEAPFDILHYLWMEIDNWAKRVIKEVTVLARAFSWSEQEILQLSPQRRQMYLDMVSV